MNPALLTVLAVAVLGASKRGGSPNLYKINGLEFWTGEDIRIRDDFVKDMVSALKKELKPIPFVQVDAPILTPEDRIYGGYAKNRMFETKGGLVLRPQTTPGSYAVAENLIERGHSLPFVVWQHGKSFRKEQKKTRKHMRLKEFYQLEFQIIYKEDHAKIDHKKLIRTVKGIVQDYVGRCRTVKAKPPHYSKRTTDIQLSKTKMELASISERTDFPDGKVMEIAIGTDRIVFNADRKRK